MLSTLKEEYDTLIEERKKGSDDSAKPSKERPQKGGDGDAITSFQSQIPLRLHGWNPSGLAFLQPSTTPPSNLPFFSSLKLTAFLAFLPYA